jgi:hypothetical protein
VMVLEVIFSFETLGGKGDSYQYHRPRILLCLNFFIPIKDPERWSVSLHKDFG